MKDQSAIKGKIKYKKRDETKNISFLVSQNVKGRRREKEREKGREEEEEEEEKKGMKFVKCCMELVCKL